MNQRACRGDSCIKKLKVILPNGAEVDYAYDSDHQIIRPERECRLPFDQSGGCSRCLKSTQDKRGLTTEYRYDEKGNPIDISLMGEDLTGLADQKITKHLSYNELNLMVGLYSC